MLFFWNLFSDKIKSGECTKADLCYSLQETIFAMLVYIRLQYELSASMIWLEANLCFFVSYFRWKLQSVRWLTVGSRRCLSLVASVVRSRLILFFPFVCVN